MIPNPFLGVFLHAIGGLAAGSFYIPFKKVRAWSWETYWLTGGFFSCIVARRVDDVGQHADFPPSELPSVWGGYHNADNISRTSGHVQKQPMSIL